MGWLGPQRWGRWLWGALQSRWDQVTGAQDNVEGARDFLCAPRTQDTTVRVLTLWGDCSFFLFF